MSDRIKGSALTMGGAACWGVSGCMGQYLFTREGMDSTWLVPIRLFLAGLILCGFFFIKDRKTLFDPWNIKKNPRNAIDLLVYGLAGVSCCQFTYFLTIQLSSAGMGTILQDVSPVIILLVVCIQQKRGPRVFEIFSIVLALVLFVFGNAVHDVLIDRLTFLRKISGMLIWLRTAGTVIALSLLMAAMYTFLPNQPRKFRSQLPGAAVTALSWSLFSYAFSIYLELRSDAVSIYGSLTTVVMLMLWLYFCMWLIFFGAMLNVVIEEKTGKRS